MGLYKRMLGKALARVGIPTPGDPHGLLPAMGEDLWVAFHEREPLRDMSDGEVRYLGYCRVPVRRDEQHWRAREELVPGKRGFPERRNFVENLLPIVLPAKMDDQPTDVHWMTLGIRPRGACAWLAKVPLDPPVRIGPGDVATIMPGQLRMAG